MHRYEEYVACAPSPEGQLVWLSRVAGAPHPYGARDKFSGVTAKFATEAEARHAAEGFWNTDPGHAPVWKVQKCETHVMA